MDDHIRFSCLRPHSRKPTNEYRICGEEAFIFLQDGYVALIDAADVPRVGEFRWRVIHVNGTVYVYTTRSEQGRSVGYYLHRIITDAPVGLTVDHIDHNPLNNRQSNLRVVTHQENCQNRRMKSAVEGDCCNCGMFHRLKSNGRCLACAVYLKRTGHERPARLYDRQNAPLPPRKPPSGAENRRRRVARGLPYYSQQQLEAKRIAEQRRRARKGMKV